MWGARRPGTRRFPWRPGQRRRFIKGFCQPVSRCWSIADLLGGADGGSRQVRSRASSEHSGWRAVGGTGQSKSLAHSPLEFLYGLFSELCRGPSQRNPVDGRADAALPPANLSRWLDTRKSATWAPGSRPTSFRRVQENHRCELPRARRLQTAGGGRPDIQAQLRQGPQA